MATRFAVLVTSCRCLALMAMMVLPGSPANAQQRRMPSPNTMIGLGHTIIQQGMLERGAVETFSPILLDDAALVWPGMPLVTGRERIGRALSLVGDGSPADDGVHLQIQPLRMILSSDSSAMLVYGVAHWAETDGSAGRFGRYLMAWRRQDHGWKLGAFGLLGLPSASPEKFPDTLAPRGNEAILVSSGDPADFVQADLAFAAAAGEDAAGAFRRWAAPDAVTFATNGVLRRGPEEIAAAIEQVEEGYWEWRPFAAGASDDGMLGWTLGEGSLVVRGTTGLPDRTWQTTYMTLWQRQPDGGIRFIAEGGNAVQYRP